MTFTGTNGVRRWQRGVYVTSLGGNTNSAESSANAKNFQRKQKVNYNVQSGISHRELLLDVLRQPLLLFTSLHALKSARKEKHCTSASIRWPTTNSHNDHLAKCLTK